MIALVDDIDDILPSVEGIQQVNDCTWSFPYSNQGSKYNGVLGLPSKLICVQQIYKWPFAKKITRQHLQLIQLCHGNTSTRRSRTLMGGHYHISSGPCATSQCSASLGLHPSSKHLHHHYDFLSMNSSLLPALSWLRKRLLHESLLVSLGCGMYMASIITKCLGIQAIDVLPFCLFTWNFYHTRHQDHDFWDQVESESIIQAATSEDRRFSQYFKGLLQLSSDACKGTRLPVESTCCWTLAEDHDEFEFRQHFVRTTY